MTENQNIKLKPRLQKKRHVAKTITWRIIGSLDTWLMSWILIQFFGENSQEAGEAASYIAGLELISKTILYYFLLQTEQLIKNVHFLFEKMQLLQKQNYIL